MTPVRLLRRLSAHARVMPQAATQRRRSSPAAAAARPALAAALALMLCASGARAADAAPRAKPSEAVTAAAGTAQPPSATPTDEAWLQRAKVHLETMRGWVAYRMTHEIDKDLPGRLGQNQHRQGESTLTGWRDGEPVRSWVQPVHPDLDSTGAAGLPSPWNAADHPERLLDLVDGIDSGADVQIDGVKYRELTLRGHIDNQATARWLARDAQLEGLLRVRLSDGRPTLLTWEARGVALVKQFRYELQFGVGDAAHASPPLQAEVQVLSEIPILGQVSLRQREHYAEWAPRAREAASVAAADSVERKPRISAGPGLDAPPLPPQPLALPAPWNAAALTHWLAEGQRNHTLFSPPERFQLGPLWVGDVRRSWVDIRETRDGPVNKRERRSTLRFRAEGEQHWEGRCARTEHATSWFNTLSYDANTDTEFSCTCSGDGREASLTVNDTLRPGAGEIVLAGQRYNLRIAAVQGYAVNLRVPTPGYLVDTVDGQAIGAVDPYPPGQAWWAASMPASSQAAAACLSAAVLLLHTP